ncbi:hypothetical protein D3C73_809630 [compost metagenome]
MFVHGELVQDGSGYFTISDRMNHTSIKAEFIDGGVQFLGRGNSFLRCSRILDGDIIFVFAHRDIEIIFGCVDIISGTYIRSYLKLPIRRA